MIDRNMSHALTIGRNAMGEMLFEVLRRFEPAQLCAIGLPTAPSVTSCRVTGVGEDYRKAAWLSPDSWDLTSTRSRLFSLLQQVIDSRQSYHLWRLWKGRRLCEWPMRSCRLMAKLPLDVCTMPLRGDKKLGRQPGLMCALLSLAGGWPLAAQDFITGQVAGSGVL